MTEIIDEEIETIFKLKFWSLVMVANRGFDPREFTEFDQRILYYYPNLKSYLQDLMSTGKSQEQIKMELQLMSTYGNETLRYYSDYVCKNSQYLLKCPINPHVHFNIVYFGMLRGAITFSKDEIEVIAKITTMKTLARDDPISFLTTIINVEKERDNKVKTLRKTLPTFKIQSYSVTEMINSRVFFPGPDYHYYNPKSIKRLTMDEIKTLSEYLTRSNLKTENLKPYLMSDGLVKYNAYLPRDVIEIVRESPVRDSVISEEIDYRVVVDIENVSFER